VPALRALLELPFEIVIVSHGEPVHTRAAYERTLELPPWKVQKPGFLRKRLKNLVSCRERPSRQNGKSWYNLCRVGG